MIDTETRLDLERQALGALEEHGLLLPPERQEEQRRRLQQKAGVSLSAALLGPLLPGERFPGHPGTPTHRLLNEVIPLVFGFGHRLGAAIARMHGANADQVDLSARVNALFNTMLCLFDRVCDLRPDLAPSLLERASREALLEALDPDGEEDGLRLVFPVRGDDAIELALLLPVMEEYFRESISLARGAPHPSLGEDLACTVLLMHEAEIRSVDLTFEEEAWSPQIYPVLRNKSSLPGWATFLTSAMASSRSLHDNLALFREAALKLGDVFWIIDDVIDTVDDLESGRWSYTWLRMATDHGVDMTPRDDAAARDGQLVRELLDRRVVARSITDLAAGLGGLEEIAGLLGDCPPESVDEVRAIVLADVRDTFEIL